MIKVRVNNLNRSKRFYAYDGKTLSKGDATTDVAITQRTVTSVAKRLEKMGYEVSETDIRNNEVVVIHNDYSFPSVS